MTSQNEKLLILDVGRHNHLAGPDFFNAKIHINEQLWAGNVEVHVNASDWFIHGHEKDPNYENVILHVVWTDDIEIKRRDNTLIPTLALKGYISDALLNNYQKLFNKSGLKFINCENDISTIDPFVFNNWFTRLYIERLEEKSILIQDLLVASKNDWEKVLFILLLKNFGSKINGASFLSLAQAVDFPIIRKLKSRMQFESLLMGMVGLLEDDSIKEPYYTELKKEYHYLKQKHSLNAIGVLSPDFFKLRPTNFPTIRLSQFAGLYTVQPNLFHKILNTKNTEDYYEIFNIASSEFWDNHFTFARKSKKSKKKLSKRFIDLLLINTLVPLRFYHAKHMGRNDNEAIIDIIQGLKVEENSIISRFKALGVPIVSSKDSQAVLQLYNKYCIKNKCLQCAVGSSLLSGNI